MPHFAFVPFADAVSPANPIGANVNFERGIACPREIGIGVRNLSAEFSISNVLRIAHTPVLNDFPGLAVFRGTSLTAPHVRRVAIVQGLLADGASDGSGRPFFLRVRSWGAGRERDAKQPSAALACHFNQSHFICIPARDLAWMKFAIARDSVFVEPNRLFGYP